MKIYSKSTSRFHDNETLVYPRTRPYIQSMLRRVKLWKYMPCFYTFTNLAMLNL